jgi:signal transduction histidine kinase
MTGAIDEATDDLVGEAPSVRDVVTLVRSAPQAELGAIVELAAKVCGTPMATINVITETAQHQVAAYGFDAAICRREDSMCAAVLDEDTPLVVPDARLDPRFKDNPFVTGQIGHVRFYASHKLVTPEGLTIGTLCVFDEKPAALNDDQIGALSTLAARIVDVLELSLRSRQLAASNERLASFAGRVSHDLKSPLTTLTMSLGVLKEQLDSGDIDPDQIGWLLDRALSGSERMAALINNVLAYARLGGGLVAEPVDLDAVLTDVLTDLSKPLAGATTTIHELPTVTGDSVQLRSVLQNLLDNAAKYRRPDRPLALVIDAVRRGPTWRISITDNGVGIAPGDRERVFQPLVRVDDDGRGSGIGLDTCRRVIDAHGGSMGISGARGGGTTVWFELPV